MRKNTASQIIGAQMITAADGTAFTGSVTCYVTGDGGTQAIGTVGSGACTHEGNGFHTYAPAQAETNYDHVAFTFVGSGAIPVTVQVYPSFPQTGDAFARLGAPAGASVSADVAAVKAQTAAIETDTQDLQAQVGTDGDGLTAVPWNAAWDAEVQSECADALAAYDGPTNAEMEARTLAAASYATASAQATTDGKVDDILTDTGTTLPATLSTIAGYLDTEIAAIKAKTDNLPSDPADQSAVEAAITGLLATQLADAYAANGAQPTLQQAIMAIHQHLMAFAISGTSRSVKKLNGSDTAFTETLDDDTSPTALTRA